MADKKIVTMLLGSPRIGGNTESMADAFAEGAQAKGYEVRKVHLAAMKLKGCMDCRKCWSTGKPCVQNDDMDMVYPDIEAADVVVFVSPLYFYSWSTQIKPVWDRLLPFYMPGAKRTLPHKRTALLAACGDEEEEMLEGITISFKNASRFLGWKSVGQVLAPAIYKRGDIQEKGKKYLEAAKKLGESL